MVVLTRAIPRRITRVLTLVSLCSVITGLGFFLRVNFLGTPISTSRLDRAIGQAQHFLYESGHFERLNPGEGTNPIDAWFVYESLRTSPSSELLDTVSRAQSKMRAMPKWHLFVPLPGESEFVRSPALRGEIVRLMTQPDRRGDTSLWNLWICAGLHADIAELDPASEARFLGAHWRDWYGYSLTHRFLSYHYMQELHPEHARRRGVLEAFEKAAVTIMLESHIDPFVSDLYIERVAFLLLPDRIPLGFRKRWIDRILDAQNSDGGWTFARAPSQTSRDLLGLSRSLEETPSSTHATFLAVYALTRYQALTPASSE